jgi:eukaryotic-like serine/threonine-protein kinase
MGLLMVRQLLIVSIFLSFAGCSSSVIKITGSPDKGGLYPMFGKVPSRNFHTPVDLPDTFNLKWEAETNGGFSNSSITYSGNYIFINDLSGRVYCFELKSGKLRGQLKHKGPVYTTPVINNYKVIYIETLPDEDRSVLRVYNFLEGRQIAEKEVNGRVKTEMVMVGNEIYFATEKGSFYKFSHIGDQYWVKETGMSVSSSPAADSSNIFIPGDNGDIRCYSLSNGEEIWKRNFGTAISSGITISGQDLFGADRNGSLYSVSKDGSLNWKVDCGARITALPLVKNDRLYVVTLAGAVYSINRKTGKIIWSQKTSGVFNTTPAITNNYLVIPDVANRIVFIDLEDGNEKNIIELPNRAKLSPVITENMMIIGFDRGVLRAYEFQ